MLNFQPVPFLSSCGSFSHTTREKVSADRRRPLQGLSLLPMPADVDLRGQLENHVPLTLSGKLNPLSQDLFAAPKIRFKTIDLVSTPSAPAPCSVVPSTRESFISI